MDFCLYQERIPLLRFFCDGVYLALMVKQCSSVSNALYLLSQQFGARGLKTDMSIMGSVSSREALSMTRIDGSGICEGRNSVAREVRRDVYSAISNSCHCAIGAKNLLIDYDRLFEQLHLFYLELKNTNNGLQNQ